MFMQNKKEIISIGLPDFSIRLDRISADTFQMKSWVGLSEYGMEPAPLFGEEGVQVKAEEGLVFLAAHWPSIAGVFGDYGIDEAEIDLSGIAISAINPVTFIRRGVFIGFEQAKPRTDLESHSVVVVECLLKLGDVLAQNVQNSTVLAAWDKAKSRTHLFPFAIDTFGMDEALAKEQITAEARWLAQQMGETFEQYALLAKWVEATSDLSAVDPAIKQPDVAQRQILKASLPDETTVKDLVSRAAAVALPQLSKTIGEYELDALSMANSQARQHVVYGRWYGNHKEKRALSHEGIFTGRFSIRLTEFDKASRTGKAKVAYAKPAAEITAASERAADVLSGFIGRHIVVTGAGQFTKFQKAPVSINVEDAEIDQAHEHIRAMFKNMIVDDD